MLIGTYEHGWLAPMARHYFTYKWTTVHNPSNTIALICFTVGRKCVAEYIQNEINKFCTSRFHINRDSKNRNYVSLNFM